MKQMVLLVAAFVALGSTGVLHGLRTDRWGRAGVVVEAARALDGIPERFDGWVSTPVEIDERQLEIAEIAGYVCRRYVHEASGQDVLILMVCGRPGAIGAHSPDVCYEGAGFRMADDPARQLVKGPVPAEFWLSVATRPEPRLQHLALWWAWSSDGKSWEAPANPRIHFARAPVLFKLYAIRQLTDPTKAIDPADPVNRLLDKLLPLVRDAILPR